MVSYGLRVVLAIGLYAVSYWRLPILAHLQLPQQTPAFFERGFWLFSPDAFFFHYGGFWFADALKTGRQVIDPGFPIDYFLIVAGLYRLLGPHPLYPILLNGLVATAMSLLVYRIGCRLMSLRGARWATIFVSFWPSAILWSSQLLKDALCWFLLCLSVLLFLRLFAATQEAAPTPRRTNRWVTWAGWAVVLVILTRLRAYLGMALMMVAGVTVLAYLWSLRRRPRSIRWATCLGILMVLGVSVKIASFLDLRQWVYASSSSRPAVSTPSPLSELTPAPTPVTKNPTALSALSARTPAAASTPTASEPSPTPISWLSRIEQTSELVLKVSPQSLTFRRQGFATTGDGGHSAIDSTVRFSHYGDVLAYLPRALAIGFLAPFPWQWLDTQGSAGVMRALASIEMLALYLLYPAFLIGAGWLLRSRWTDGVFILSLIVVLLLGMTLVVNNLGILFRIRLPAIFMVLLVAGEGVQQGYVPLVQRFLKRRDPLLAVGSVPH